MYMANAKILRLVPNATYISLTRIGGFGLADARHLRYPKQEIPTLGNARVLSFVLGDAKVPNANGFASQWNIGLKPVFHWNLPLANSRVANAENVTQTT